MHLVLDLLQMAKRRERRFMHSRAHVEVNMLREQSGLEPARPRNLAAIRSLFFVYQAKNRRLAGAVTSDQTDMLTRIDLKRGAAQNILRAEGFVNVGKPKQHSSSMSPTARRANFCKQPLLTRGLLGQGRTKSKRVRTQKLLARTRRNRRDPNRYLPGDAAFVGEPALAGVR